MDIENVVGGAVLRVEQAEGAHGSVREAAHLDGTEHVVIGTSHIGLVSTGLGWRGSRLVVRSGENGADLALLDVLKGERVEERFDEVVLVSGDGIFADSVAALGAAGVRVTVLAPLGHCSKRLRMAATHVVLFDRMAIDYGGAA
ncbi:NYN domain-containing protein [Terrabacter koreensis]